MRALVINPPFLEPHRPPISVAIIAEIFRLQGYDVTVIDLNIELFHELGADCYYENQTQYLFGTAVEEPYRRLLHRHLADIEADWIAVSCFSLWNVGTTEMLCEHLRKVCNAKVVVGGPGAEYDDRGALWVQQGLVDYWIAGEGEVALTQLLQGQTNVSGINGVPPEQIMDIENLPLPNYGYFDLDRYDRLLDTPDVFIYGSRGCVRRCTFCDVQHYWPRFRWRTGHSIAQEMIRNYELYGVRNFYFSDSLVNGNMKEFSQLAETLATYQERLFRYSGYAIVRSKKEHSADWFDVVGASGAMQWNIGVETGVDRIRFEMKKKFTNADVDWHLEQSQRIGLANTMLMISTWYNETPEEHAQYLEIFPRWQRFALDGTIAGMNLTTNVEMLHTAPIWQQHGIEYDFDPRYADGNSQIQRMAWVSRSRPELTHHEKMRRTLAIFEQAVRYDWPINNAMIKINELLRTIQGFKI
jgi:hypothetical protein